MEWTLKKKVENLIRTKLTIDNVATFYDAAIQFEAEVYKSALTKINETETD